MNAPIEMDLTQAIISDTHGFRDDQGSPSNLYANGQEAFARLPNSHGSLLESHRGMRSRRWTQSRIYERLWSGCSSEPAGSNDVVSQAAIRACNIGPIYNVGFGVPLELMKVGYIKVAKEGYDNAQRCISGLYFGEDVPQVYFQAMEWYFKDPKQGD
ncbi:hypothetical protein BGZ88_005498, partial [Linnemannia elongata]